MKDYSTRACLLVGTAAASILAADPALAQDSGGDIVVTARRVEERLQDVPISISVFTPQQISDRNIATAADLGTYTPSLSVNSRYGAEKASFTLRGFGQDQSTSPSVGVYFADVIAPRANGGTTSGNGAGAGAFFDLQNIQVLKGPQGTLFGRNTTGGAVLLVPQKPTDNLEGYIEGTYGNFDQKRVQAVVNIPLADTFRVRLGVDRNVRDGYLKNKSGIGPKDFADLNYWAARLSIVGELTPNLENYTIASYSLSKTNSTPARIVACNPNANSGQRFASVAACAQIARQAARGDSLYDIENNVPNPYQRFEQWQVINTTTWKASDSLTVKNIVSYTNYTEEGTFSINGDNFTMPAFPANFAPALPAALPAGTPYTYVYITTPPGQQIVSQSTFTEEFQLQGQIGDALQWQAGAYLEVSKPRGPSAAFSVIYQNCTNPLALQCTSAFGFPGVVGAQAGSISSTYDYTSYNNKGFYGQATYAITDQLKLTGGIRYTIDKETLATDRVRIRFANGINGPVFFCNDTLRFRGTPGPTGAPTPLQVTDQNTKVCHSVFNTKSEKPTWLINLDYKPIEDIMLYAKYARGYRQGGINPLNIGLELWGPEKLDSYEAGIKTSFRGAVSGYFNVAAFYNDLSNQQIQANLVAKPGTGITGGNAIVNAGKSRIKGVEVDASVSPFTGLKLDLGYTYLDTELLELAPQVPDPAGPFSAVTPRGLVGGALNYAPKHRLSATANYTLPLDESIGKITFGATWTYTAKQVTDPNSTCIPNAPVASSCSPAAQIAGYGSNLGTLPSTRLLNLNINWMDVGGAPIDLALFATNVTKEVYPAAIGSGWGAAGFENYIMAPPRMYGARLKYRFGN